MAAEPKAAPAAAAPGGDPNAWLHAWYDPVAGLKTLSQCLRFADVGADGDYRLLVADQDRKMKVYKGTGVSSVHPLLDVPVAIATFQADLAVPRVPSVAVAAGPFVFIYRNLRPYNKFALPPLAISPEETETWAQLAEGKVEVSEAVRRFTEARDGGIAISSRAQVRRKCRRRSARLRATPPPPPAAAALPRRTSSRSPTSTSARRTSQASRASRSSSRPLRRASTRSSATRRATASSRRSSSGRRHGSFTSSTRQAQRSS